MRTPLRLKDLGWSKLRERWRWNEADEDREKALLAKVTPKGKNVPPAEVRRRRVRNKQARAARKRNRGR